MKKQDIVLLGEDFGFVIDERFQYTDASFYQAYTALAREVGFDPSHTKHPVDWLKFQSGTMQFLLKFPGATKPKSLSVAGMKRVNTSSGGNLNNIAHNLDVLFGRIRPTAAPSMTLYVTCERMYTNHLDDLKLVHAKRRAGHARHAVIISDPTGEKTFSFITKPQFSLRPSVLRYIPKRPITFIVGMFNHRDEIRLIRHSTQYPDTRIIFIPSTHQVLEGTTLYRTFLPHVDQMICNLYEACTFLHLPYKGAHKPLANRAATRLHKLGIPDVVITDGRRGSYRSVKGASVTQRTFQPLVSAPRSAGWNDITGCGDVFTSGIIFSDLIGYPFGMKLAAELASLKTEGPFSHLVKIPKGLKSQVLQELP